MRSGRGVGSAMGAAELARKWKDVEVKLTDVRAGEDVGYVAIVERESVLDFGEEGWTKKLQKGGRLYS